MGKWMGMSEAELSLLSLASTMHDVGKVRISEEILLKPGKLTDEEFEEMKRHTIYGYEILKETEGLHASVPLVALQHHERIDGSGYPYRMSIFKVDPLSRIVAVADVFHAMSSKRPYHEPMPFHEVVSRMREGSFGELDPHVVTVFLNRMIRYLVGRKVTLTDGRDAVVVLLNAHDDLHPLVRLVDGSFLDLSKERLVHIQSVRIV